MRAITTFLLIGVLCVLLPFFGQAATVKCLGADAPGAHEGYTVGTTTRDLFYEVTLTDEEIDYFHVGWFGCSTATDFVALDSSGTSIGWSEKFDSGNEPYTGYVDHGETTTSIGNTPSLLVWDDGGNSISNGTFYFGYDFECSLVTVGFLAMDFGSTVLNEDWAEEVGRGLGPVHAPIPEPATAMMLAFGAGVGVFVRRIRR